MEVSNICLGGEKLLGIGVMFKRRVSARNIYVACGKEVRVEFIEKKKIWTEGW